MMRYNVYRKHNYYDHTEICVKLKAGDCREYAWIRNEDLSYGYYAKYYTKAYLNIFEAKQIINGGNSVYNKHYLGADFEYCIEKVKD